MYDITTWGWKADNTKTIVEGITNAIVRAHKRRVPAKLEIASGKLSGTAMNRSPLSYLVLTVFDLKIYLFKENPPAERAKYEADIDHESVTVKVTAKTGDNVAVLNWFPIHGTSMNNWNSHISG